MADGAHNDGADDGQGIFDPFLVPDVVFNDDFLSYLLDMNGGIDLPPPPLQAAPGQTATISAGPSGDNSLLERPPPTLDFNGSAVHNSAPAHNAGDPTTSSGAQDAGAASTSATAQRPPPPSTSSTVQQNASLDCTGCQILREIVHSNGLEATKLSIHGVAAGVFNHATLEVYRVDSNGLAMTITTQLTHQSYVDFRGRDYEWVKQYLTDYAQQRAGGGYIVLEDSISAFQDALCTSMFCHGGHAGDHREVVAQETNGGHADDRREAVAQEINGGHADDRREAVAQETNGGHADDRREAVAQENGGHADDHREAVSIEINGSHQRVVGGRAVQPAMVDRGNVNVPAGPSEPIAKEQGRRPEIRPAAKTALAIQRERASNLQLEDIARYFHLPMVEAAKELRICATVLKGTSRKCNIPRWPYRKVKSINRQIAKLRRSNGDQTAMREIERLTDYRRRIYAGLE